MENKIIVINQYIVIHLFTKVRKECMPPCNNSCSVYLCNLKSKQKRQKLMLSKTNKILPLSAGSVTPLTSVITSESCGFCKE